MMRTMTNESLSSVTRRIVNEANLLHVCLAKTVNRAFPGTPPRVNDHEATMYAYRYYTCSVGATSIA